MGRTPVQLALAQIASTEEPERNLELLAERVRAAAAAGARLVVFPEATMCCFGVKLSPVAEPLDGPWATRVREVAAAAGVTVVVGMFTPAPDGRVYNTLLATGGGVEAGYDKIHLFDAFGFAESDTVAPGTEPVTIEVDGATVGLATCYDLRFPEMFRLLLDADAAVVVVPAAWPAARVEHWSLLGRARAIEDQLFVVACNTAGTHAGHEMGGRSQVVGPSGEVLAEAGTTEQVLSVDLDVEGLAAVRAAFPVLADLRL
jgi:deaminated glutathione amidase